MKATIKVTLQVLVFSLVFSKIVTHQAWGDADCYDDKLLVMDKCEKNLKIRGDYIRPGHECCNAVRGSDIVCVCGKISLEEEAKISIAKVIYVARDCGKPIPAGNKCGGFIVPPSLSSTPRAYP
ncbi:unnamed protein product [Urochloa decumbens]|uniref:Bifunctional inhibitor/plant lipid transfer protein/seed storage helical domain-containing protein n=1 Tax=Urochloa decumbens TaxID=240449 RepID=A0ABC9B7G5_9POAL